MKIMKFSTLMVFGLLLAGTAHGAARLTANQKIIAALLGTCGTIRTYVYDTKKQEEIALYTRELETLVTHNKDTDAAIKLAELHTKYNPRSITSFAPHLTTELSPIAMVLNLFLCLEKNISILTGNLAISGAIIGTSLFDIFQINQAMNHAQNLDITPELRNYHNAKVALEKAHENKL